MTEITVDRAARVRQFAEVIIEKLSQPRNVAKADDWRDLDEMELYWKLHKEQGELLHALYKHDDAGSAAEAVDVAAFAFMLWDKFDFSDLEEKHV